MNKFAPRALLAIAALAASVFAQEFRHPGVVVTRGQLDYVKKKIEAGQEPWKSAFAKMKGSSYASMSMTPRPRASVDCGAYSSPNNGCSEELNDAWSAYTQALLYAYTGNAENAKKAIQILNAWSAVLKTHTNHNAPLQSGWAASICVRAAEIIKHTYDGWAPADVERYGKMLREAYMPLLAKELMNTNGNWHLTMADAMIGIGVFLDDREIFDKAVVKWRAHTIAYIYITEDGPTPIAAPGQTKTMKDEWYGQTVYKDGVGQETCRDLGHMEYGLASIGSGAETALLQGVDLYGEQAKRIVAGFEFDAGLQIGPKPSWLCNLEKRSMPTFEIVYNHFANRKGVEMPNTKKWLEKLRPTGVDKHMAWETLTHANTGSEALVGEIVAVGPQTEKARAPAAPRLILDRDGALRLSRPGPAGEDRFYRLDGALLAP